jgi:hypothetical protein
MATDLSADARTKYQLPWWTCAWLAAGPGIVGASALWVFADAPLPMQGVSIVFVIFAWYGTLTTPYEVEIQDGYIQLTSMLRSQTILPATVTAIESKRRSRGRGNYVKICQPENVIRLGEGAPGLSQIIEEIRRQNPSIRSDV